MSESGLKKLLTARNCSYEKLCQICDAANLELQELLERVKAPPLQEVVFTQSQEKYLLQNRRLFWLFWKIVYERMKPEEARSSMGLPTKDFFKYLRKLDEMKLLELHPNSQVKIPPEELVRWVGQGPLMMWVKRQWPRQLIHEVTAKGELDRFEHYSLRYYQLTEVSFLELVQRVQELDQEFARRSLNEMKTKRSALHLVRQVTAIAPGSYVRPLLDETP